MNARRRGFWPFAVRMLALLGLAAPLPLLASTVAVAQVPVDPTAVTHLVTPVVFPEDNGTYTISVWIAKQAGSANAAPVPTDKLFRLVFDKAIPLESCGSTVPKDKCDAVRNRIAPAVVVGREVILSGIPATYAGTHKVWLQIGDDDPQPSGAGMKLSLSLVGRWAPVFAALGILAALLALVLGLLAGKGQRRILANGQSINLAQAIFIDTETSTYSLSKLQFYIWMFAALGGYLYLSVAKSLVQGSLVLSDVPANLPGIILISVGTSVVSTGISTLAGSKGSGDFAPMPSDLITSGGVVAPERLQHLLWTLIGGLAFFFYTLAISPAEIQDLPTIPPGFLELMGISAAGYLGGKLVRGPGPKVTAVRGAIVAGAAGAANGITLTVDGTNLANGGATYFLAQFAAGAGAPAADVQIRPTNLPAQAAATYTTQLTLNVPATDGLVFAAGTKYRFSIVNPDGEKASWDFTA